MRAFGKLVIVQDPKSKGEGRANFSDTGDGRMWDHRLKDVTLKSADGAKLRVRGIVNDQGALYCLAYPRGYEQPGKITFLLDLPKDYGTVSVTGKDPANHKRYAPWSSSFTTYGLNKNGPKQ